MAVNSIDHVAIPIQDIDGMRTFYEAFGFRWDTSGAPHLYAVTLAGQKLNFHAPSLWRNLDFSLRAPSATPGCGDFCFRWHGDSGELHETIRSLDLQIIEGPVKRVGGAGIGSSVYVRDPDANLVEFIVYPKGT